MGWGLCAVVGCYTGVEDRGPQAESLGADTEDGATTGEDPDEEPPSAEGDGCQDVSRVGASRMPRLTAAEYTAAVDDLFGAAIDPSDLPGDELVGPFQANVYSSLGASQLRRYLDAAERVAAHATPSLLAEHCPANPDDVDCARGVLTEVARRVYRRPLTDAQRQSLEQVFNDAAVDGATAALQQGLSASLMSPFFLYRFEPTPPMALEQPVAVDAYAVAQRMSFLLWGSVPDDALLEAARTDSLLNADERRVQALRMLEDPRASRAIGQRYAQWAGVSNLATASKDPDLFGEFDDELAADMTAAFASFTADLIATDGTLEDLLLSRRAFVSPRLAQLYGVQVSGTAGTHGLFEVELPATERAGFLTRAGVMANLAHEDQSAPVLRGSFIRTAILCQPNPPPPPTVDDEPPPVDPNASPRERLAMHSEDPSCATCHVRLDPLGFGLEHYDAVGAYRTVDGNLDVDAQGELVSADVAGTFEGGVELSEMLAESDEVRRCIATQHVRLAQLRVIEQGDPGVACLVDELLADLDPASTSLRELLIQTVVHDSFTQRQIAPAE